MQQHVLFAHSGSHHKNSAITESLTINNEGSVLQASPRSQTETTSPPPARDLTTVSEQPLPSFGGSELLLFAILLWPVALYLMRKHIHRAE